MAKKSKDTNTAPSIKKRNEGVRKFLVSLKKNPQSIPLVMLTISFLVFSLNLTDISNTTALLQAPHMGLCAFLSMLCSILSYVCMFSAFPKRQKPNLPMVSLMLLLYAVVVVADIYYVGKIIEKTVGPDAVFKITEARIFVADAQNTLVLHVILVVLTILCVILEPVFAKLLKKIDTSKEVVDNGAIGEIELSEEE